MAYTQIYKPEPRIRIFYLARGRVAHQTAEWVLTELHKLVQSDRELLFCQNDQGRFPIHAAAAAGNVDGMKALASYNQAQLILPDSDGNLPLHRAAIRGIKKETAVQIALLAPTSLIRRNFHYQTPAQTATHFKWHATAEALLAEENIHRGSLKSPDALLIDGPRRATTALERKLAERFPELVS